LRGGFVESIRGCFFFKLDGELGPTTSFYVSELTAPTARVEVIPPPVDPDLVLAREWFKGRYPSCLCDPAAGGYDYHDELRAYLAGLKASKAGGRS